MASKNIYHRRLVAESSAKACWVCYKLSSTVLITPDQDDWFNVCPGHLTDSKFAIPKDASELAARKRDEDIEKEIEAVKKEYQEKMQKKLERKQQKDSEKEGKKDDKKKEKKENDESLEQAEKEKDAKIQELEKKKKDTEKAKVDGPRIFELQKAFYQMRLQRKKAAEVARRTRERLRDPGTFPSVPNGDL